MKKEYIIAALVIAVLSGAGYYYVNNVMDKTPIVDIKEQRSMMQIRYDVHDNVNHIYNTKAKEISTYIADVKDDRQDAIDKYIFENTIFVKNNDTKLNTSSTLDGEYVETKRGEKLIKFDLVLDSESVEVALKVKKNYLDDDYLYIAKSEYITDVSELISRKIDGVDYNAYEKVYEYESNPRVEVKGVYITETSTGNSKLTEMIDLANNSEINAFVIDVKDDNGNILFYSEAAAKHNPSGNKRIIIKDMPALMKKLKDNNIYAIARIVTFKSPRYANEYPNRAITYSSTDKVYVGNGMSWASAYDRKLWEYNIDVAKEAAELGFNEIQFDYVRFPASGGGKLDRSLNYKNDLDETKTEAIQKFLKYANDELRPYEVYISADVFGWAASALDDVGIGQQWEGISNVVDYISPMIYPSHYGPGNYGLSIPDAFPYETVYRTTEDAIERNKNLMTPSTIRPWIQDFTAPWVKGHIRYGAKEVKLQIDALKDIGINEYILWNAGNRYSTDALK
ncbi:MAG: putative glycoside hydrolase [Acidaminobacteraceae bacterium]